jgi:hypothetical protein
MRVLKGSWIYVSVACGLFAFGCMDAGEIVARHSGVDISAECAPGDIGQQDCNTCSCTDEGKWACTAMACDDDEVACGARAGDTCTEREYCAYKEGEFCGLADAEATCQPRPESCKEDYNPVCGCDQKTYRNACSAAVAGTGVYKSGKCSQ